MYTKIREIKYIKNASPWRTSNAVDPAERGLKRIKIKRDMPNFCPEEKRASQPTARIDGIDGNFLFGNTRLYLLTFRRNNTVLSSTC